MKNSKSDRQNSQMQAAETHTGLRASELEAIRAALGREPNDLELALYGALWSEHCGYKHTRLLLKQLPTSGCRILQGPGENAGVVDLGDGQAVTFKIESHNHPSAIAPFQGAATGVGGIIRDIMAMGAFPIAVLDALYFGRPDEDRQRWLVREVIRGIGEYGNSVGVPTVGGELWFLPGYAGNPLVNAMCVGYLKHDQLQRAQAGEPGNLLLIVGNLTGRDGMGGAAFASRRLEKERHEDQGAVQVGDPFMERLLLEACREVIQEGLVVGIQDMGAAGILSAVAETAARSGRGVIVRTDLVPTREPEMTPGEILLSESQERMLLVVEPSQVPAIQRRFAKWDLQAVVFGEVTDDGHFTVEAGGEVVAAVPLASLTEAPAYRPSASPPKDYEQRLKLDLDRLTPPTDWEQVLLDFLASPNICSRRWVYRQYDHHIQLRTIVGPGGDAAVLRLPDSEKGLAVTVDGNGRYLYLDPRLGTAHVVAEAARNLVATGAEPLAVTDGLNFGNPEQPEVYWQLEEALAGMSEACTRLGTPVVSGNASLYNETREHGAVLPTVIVGMVGLLSAVRYARPASFSVVGDLIYLVGRGEVSLAGSEFLHWFHGLIAGRLPILDYDFEKRLHHFLLTASKLNLLHAMHDISTGGLLVALVESVLTGGQGCELSLQAERKDLQTVLFGEGPGRFIVAVPPHSRLSWEVLARLHGVPFAFLGKITPTERFLLTLGHQSLIALDLSQLRQAYETGLPQLLESTQSRGTPSR